MLLVVPLAAFIGFLLSLVAVAALRIRFMILRRRGGSPSVRELWWYRSVGQLTLVFFLMFVITRVYYLL